MSRQQGGVYEDQPDLARQPGGIGCGIPVNHLCPAVAGGGGMSDFWEGYVPEPTKPAPVIRDELTEPLGCVVVRPLVANRATPPTAQEDIQRLSALVRAQQITIDKLEQARSAPVQEPVAFNAGVPPLYPEMKDGETISVEYTTPPAAPVQEPKQSEIFCGVDFAEGVLSVSVLRRRPDDVAELLHFEQIELQPPAAQKPWVGLTDEEIAKLDCYDHLKFARAIEAKLKEKNGWYRQHVIDGSPCWCEPETSYTDPETGASVVVHKEPQ